MHARPAYLRTRMLMRSTDVNMLEDADADADA